MSDAEVQEALAQVYAALRVLERHGERCVLLRRERVDAVAGSFRQTCSELDELGYGASVASWLAANKVGELLREADEEAERYGC